MNTLRLFFLTALANFGATTCFGQSNWMDYTRAALPRITAPNYNAGLNQPLPGYPTATGANYDPNLQGIPNMQGNGFNTSLVPNRKDWKLGVYVQNTDVGAVVTQVAPGSAGQLAGIEPNDVIVAVGSSRVGAFDNRIVELADEIRRNTDSMGRVSLLVLDSRQRILESLPITMNSTSQTLTGTVVTRDRASLPYGATLTVQLQNVSQPFYEIAGGKSVTRADGSGPFAFELNCDPRYLDPRNQYQINAVISLNNQVVYGLLQPIAIDMNSFGQPINLMLERNTSVVAGLPANNLPGSTGFGGNVVNVGYPSAMDNSNLQQLFLQLLGRAPSNREIVAWQSYLQQGNSINDLKIKLLSNAQFRERFQNDGAYIQQLVTSLTNRAPNQQELSYWMGRLQATGAPELVINEMLQKNR